MHQSTLQKSEDRAYRMGENFASLIRILKTLDDSNNTTKLKKWTRCIEEYFFKEDTQIANST